MIARVWGARATLANAPRYAAHLRDEVIPTLRSVDGYHSTRLLQHEDGDEVEIVVVTWWDSLEAVRGFAGPDIENAVVAGEAAALLIRYDEHVHHFDLALADDI